MGNRTVVTAVLVFTLASHASADELSDAAQGLCDSVRSCALEQMAEQDLTPEMREMMAPMLNNMCANIREGIKEVPVDHGLYQPAVGCMRSMESLSCEQLQDPERVTTPECREYERLVGEMGNAPQ